MKAPMLTKGLVCLGLLALAAPAYADSVQANLFMATETGPGQAVGTVMITDENDGVRIVTDLVNLAPGARGFHIHENGTCDPAKKDGTLTPAGAAGGHYDPNKTGKHLGPEGGGHKGDLPVLTVGQDGTAKSTMHVKGLTAAELRAKSVMIHEGGDNYSDSPKPLGGGGGRMACGVLQ